ncbi:hypothetical protein FWJ28_08515 [Streptococcus agalactiae]|nr:hypothetical protein FWJ29_08385 [Streptococcus agalactiae]TYB60902.1 hypothetical protein FWJ28_08515 [Streptococcus agalactiae]TYB85106.1 hypothetical protein FWJ27_08515 [Streptococcus agalactiae]TYB92252.1 hypothetical protein FWJ30_08525 [Streptococcus agalactiae]
MAGNNNTDTHSCSSSLKNFFVDIKKNNLLPIVKLAILFHFNETIEQIYFKTFSEKNQYYF